MQNSIFSNYQYDDQIHLDLSCKVNCMYLCQKYYQELTICTKQDKHISLTKYYYSMQMLDMILMNYMGFVLFK